MKKKYKFVSKDDTYKITEYENAIFMINKSNLEFNGNQFYNAFFKDIENTNEKIEIDLTNALSDEQLKDDKTGVETHLIICNMFKEITKKLNDQLLIDEESTIVNQ